MADGRNPKEVKGRCAVVGVPGVIPLALDDLDIVVHQDRVSDTRYLSDLISDIHS